MIGLESPANADPCAVADVSVYACTLYDTIVCPPSSAGGRKLTIAAVPLACLLAVTANGADGGRPGDTPPCTSSADTHSFGDVQPPSARAASVLAPTQFPSHVECGPVSYDSPVLYAPNSAIAVTVNRYHTPFVSPLIVAVVPVAATTVVHATVQ